MREWAETLVSYCAHRTSCEEPTWTHHRALLLATNAAHPLLAYDSAAGGCAEPLILLCSLFRAQCDAGAYQAKGLTSHGLSGT